MRPIGILRCLSTDSIRQVLRTTKTEDPALFRSSYQGEGTPRPLHNDLPINDEAGDAIANWLETCKVIEDALKGVIDDAIERGNSLVIEGVGIVPDNRIIDDWRAKGGVAMGCVMNIKNSTDHRNLIFRRGEMTGKGESKKLRYFEKIRTIQDEMVRMGLEHNWLIVEQKVEPAPIEIIGDIMRRSSRQVM